MKTVSVCFKSGITLETNDMAMYLLDKVLSDHCCNFGNLVNVTAVLQEHLAMSLLNGTKSQY